jgi:drug/metabolite transporter (DMT)-like permease
MVWKEAPLALMQPNKLAVYAIPYVLISALQYQVTKDGMRFADPMTFMAARYVIASVACFALARSYKPILNRDTVLLSVATWASTTFWIFGLEYVSPAQSAVLTYTMPLFAIPLSMLILKERTSRLGWIGALIGFSGVAIYGVALAGEGGSILGAVLTIVNGVFWAVFTVYYRKVRDQDRMRTLATQFLVISLLFIPFVPFNFYASVTPEFAADLLYVSLIAGVASFFLWLSMTRMETIGKLTALVFAVPAASIAIQSILTGAMPDPASLLGFALMFVGIYVSRTHGGGLSKAVPSAGEIKLKHKRLKVF